MKKKVKFWLNMILLIVALMIFMSGYLLGNLLSKDTECINDPLVCGIKRFNEVNPESYYCDCYSEKSFQRAFYFDEDGIKLD